MTDNIHNPAHYTVYPVQPIEITRYLGFCLGNATKYALRAPYKGGVEDCKKAVRYLELERSTPQAPLIHYEYKMCCKNAKRLVHFLLHAEGDILFGDIASRQIDYLGQLESYLFALDMRYHAKLWHDNLTNMLKSVCNIKRILELRDTVGQIYEGMTGLPEGM